jgi:hypothetical protein
MWALVEPDTGTTVLYNESAGQVWSSVRPVDAAARAAVLQAVSVEVLRTPSGWRFEENWRW